MITEQIVLNSGELFQDGFSFEPDLVLLFVSPSYSDVESLSFFRLMYPEAIIAGCSTAGEIEDINIHDGSVLATGIKFEKSQIEYNDVFLPDPKKSFQAGVELIDKFEVRGLRHILVFCEGLDINPSEFVEGLKNHTDANYSITGGFAADGFDFKKTFVITNELEIKSNMAVAIGFYGDSLKIGHGALSGWDSFGVDRIVTKSKENIVYEIDGVPILDLFKNILQEQSKNLPASGMLLPLSVRLKVIDKPLVRTIMTANIEDKSIAFCGNIPEGSIVRLMKANHERLVSAAEGAAELSIEEIGNTHTDLAILISGVGRRMVLKQLDIDEVVAVRDVIGEDATIAGFYSYSEMSPFLQSKRVELQCQSMSITTFSEYDPTDFDD